MSEAAVLERRAGARQEVDQPVGMRLWSLTLSETDACYLHSRAVEAATKLVGWGGEGSRV